MNKKELVNAVWSNFDGELSKKTVEALVHGVFNAISTELIDGGSVQILGFGSFGVRDRSARTGYNPQTGKAIEIPACKVPYFKPGKLLKDAVKD